MMIVFRKYILFLSACIFHCCRGTIGNAEQTKANEIIQENPVKPHIAIEFNDPVGIKNNGVYQSKLHGKEYKGWYVATKFLDKNQFGIHPGEDWNGSGGGNTDAFQPVYAIANGVIKSIDTLPLSLGKAIMIEHILNDSIKTDTIYSVYVHIDSIQCSIGQKIFMSDQIAQIFAGTKEMSAHLHFEIRKASMRGLPLLFYPSFASKSKEWVKENYFNPSEFIGKHKK